ncbi:MAG: hypothetical protein E4H03_14110 [Myxococcales bacterium]|jgi:hypothetical protein|nr:MAG: hypothetical protein E4H03_14110 [Myxococcales bacterium]
MRSSNTRGVARRHRGRTAVPAALATFAVASTLIASTAVAQVYVVTPDANKRAASAATTIMLNPFYLAQTYEAADVQAIEQRDGSQRLSHPEAGMNFFMADVRPDGRLGIGCETASDYKASAEAGRPWTGSGESEVAR